MTPDQAILRVFVDQCVPDSAGQVFRQAGHEVQFLRERLATNSDDMLVAAVALANEAILLSLDRDFRTIAKRLAFSQNKLRALSLIKLSCRESQAKLRLAASMSLIEHEFRVMTTSGARRLFVEVQTHCIRTYR